MTVINPPYALQAGTINHPAKLFRRIVMALANEGVCQFNTTLDMKVSENSPTGMSVLVATGGCFIKGDDTSNQGLYLMFNDGNSTVTLATADATNPRIDIIVAWVKDGTEGQAGDTSVIDKVTGTPAASPSAPATPATALKLAEVLVPAAASSVVNANITDFRSVFTLGGRLGAGSRQFTGFRAQKSSNQNVSNSNAIKITFNTTEYDTNTLFASNKMTVPSGMAGFWDIRAGLGWDGNSGGSRRRIYIYLNGNPYRSSTAPPSGTVNSTCDIWATMSLAVGDFIEIYGFQDSGGGLDCLASSNTPSNTHFQAEYRGTA